MNDLRAALQAVVGQLQAGRAEQAAAAAEALCQAFPDAAEPWIVLAAAHSALERADAAQAALHRALAIAPSHPAANNNLGNLHLTRGDAAAARVAFEAALRGDPQHLGARLNLAATCLELGDHDAALRAVEAALAQAPRLADARFLHGLCLSAAGRHADAADAYAHAERLAPHDARFPYQQGLALEELKRHEDAAAAFSRSLALDPAATAARCQLLFLRRRLCAWESLDALATQVREDVRQGREGVTPFSFLSEDVEAVEQLACARTQARQIAAQVASLQSRLPRSEHLIDRDAPIRIGFVSNGFGEHPTGLLTVALFEQWVRPSAAPTLEVHLFSLGADDGGPIVGRLRAATHWHDLTGLVSVERARAVREAGIDALVDLRGWGGGGAPELFALRPAPLQVNWLAYPGTSGAPWIDYAIADTSVLPANLRPFHSEAIAYLPRCFQPSDNTRPIGTPPPRVALGLPARGAVFASFNNSYKLNRASVDRFLAILHAVPGSVLWLLAGPDGADARLRAYAAANGIAGGRLVFTPKRPHAEYLALYRHVDLFLDTNPYNAHTTASDALWAGCPVLTRPGRTFAARVAGSLNHHLGLAEMNTADDADYVAQAIRLGSDPAALAALRARLAERRERSGLFDMAGFARDFAALLTSMVQRHRAGLPPADLSLADPSLAETGALR